MIENLRNFVKELGRRHVVKVGAIYLAFLIGVLAVANDIKEPLEDFLPENSDLFVLVVLVAGFPVALIIAWAFELTPQGVRLTKDLDAEAAAEAAKSAIPPLPNSELASIAVLPFTGSSAAGPDSFLANAIPLALNNTLSRVHQLRIVSAQSSAAHSREGKDLRSLAAELEVNYVISGSVSQYGDSVRVIAELYDAQSDTLLWTQRFVVQASEVLETEQVIAEAAAMAFGGERLRLEVEHARRTETSDQAAWELVQKARGYLLNYARGSVAAAIPMLEKAIALDPDYAAAHAQMGLITAEKTLNAISDDPDQDRIEAQACIDRALRLAPNDAVVLRSAGVVQAYCGNNREAIRLLRRCTRLAPFDLGAWGYFGWPLVGTGDENHLRELHEILDRLLEYGSKHPGYPYWLFHKSVAYSCQADHQRALEFIRSAMELQPRFSLGWMHLANVCGSLGQPGEARAARDRCASDNPKITPDYFASLIGVLSDTDEVTARRIGGIRQAGLMAGPQ